MAVALVFLAVPSGSRDPDAPQEALEPQPQRLLGCASVFFCGFVRVTRPGRTAGSTRAIDTATII